MSDRVFISYSRKDKDIARKIASQLRDESYQVWIDDESVAPGSAISTAIAQGIDRSDYFLILVSGHSVQSRWVHSEAEQAFQKSMESEFPIIPVLLDGSPLPKIIKHLKYVDFRKSEKDGIKELLEFFKREARLASDSRKQTSPEDNLASTPDESCVVCLGRLSQKELREKITSRFDIHELELIWNDVLGTDLNDEAHGLPKANIALKLIEKSKRKRVFERLLQRICEEDDQIC